MPDGLSGAGPDGLAALFAPRRVAVVGASDTEGSPGAVLWRNLTTFPGEVVPVSRSATVGGRTAYPRLRDVPGPVDLAVVAVPAAGVVEVVQDAAAAGVPAVVVVSAGFAEIGEQGRALQERLLAAARHRVRVVGPNCLGVQNCDLPLNASLAGGAAVGGGGISVLTQSGSYAMAVSTWGQDEAVRFARCVSLGNSADVAAPELLGHLRREGATRVACLFLESLSDGRAFLAEAAQAAASGLQVLVTAVGRSAAGARAAAAHTAALASDRAAWESAFARSGALLVRSGREMLDAARVLDGAGVPRGPRVAVVTNSGGTGTELTDLLIAEGLEVPELSTGLQEQLRALLPAFASPRNPVDLTPVWRRFGELYPAVTDLLARSGEVDVVVPVLLHRSALDESVAAGLGDVVARLRGDGVRVPVVGCWVAGRDAWPQSTALSAAGVPCLDWPDRTARALGNALRAERLRASATPLLPLPAPSALGSGVAADAGALRSWLTEHGVPCVDTAVVDDPESAAAVADRLGYPVVLKVDHAALSHKSDVGGVRVALASPDAVRAAARDLLALATGARVVVQRQAEGLEVLVGGVRDAVLGPLVAVGLGGVLVETLGDVAFAPAPLTAPDARRLLDRLRARHVLAGVRGAPSVDVEALATVLVRVGDVMATYPAVQALDLNPVMARPGGCVAVDWRLTAG